MSIPRNSLKREVAKRKSLSMSAKPIVDATISFNQGDHLYLTGGLMTKATADAHGLTYMGVAPVTVVLGKLKSPYTGTSVDAASSIDDIAGAIYGDIHTMNLKSGDTFNPMDLVYISADQEVSSAGANAIGIYQGSTITAVSGSTGEILIGAIANAVLMF